MINSDYDFKRGELNQTRHYGDRKFKHQRMGKTMDRANQ